jgi:hypothetical protein
MSNFLRRRKAERIYRDGGWGPLLTWPIARPEGKPLVFQLRLPTGVELVDVQKLAHDAPGAPEFVSTGAAALKRAEQPGGVIMTGALCGVKETGERDVMATLTAALSALKGPLGVKEGIDVDGNTRTHTKVTQVSDKVTQVKRLSAETVPGRSEPIPSMLVEYLIETRYGMLAMAFSTRHQEMLGQWGQSLFFQVTQTGFIGEQAPAY